MSACSRSVKLTTYLNLAPWCVELNVHRVVLGIGTVLPLSRNGRSIATDRSIFFFNISCMTNLVGGRIFLRLLLSPRAVLVPAEKSRWVSTPFSIVWAFLTWNLYFTLPLCFLTLSSQSSKVTVIWLCTLWTIRHVAVLCIFPKLATITVYFITITLNQTYKELVLVASS